MFYRLCAFSLQSFSLFRPFETTLGKISSNSTKAALSICKHIFWAWASSQCEWLLKYTVLCVRFQSEVQTANQRSEMSLTLIPKYTHDQRFILWFKLTSNIYYWIDNNESTAFCRKIESWLNVLTAKMYCDVRDIRTCRHILIYSISILNAREKRASPNHQKLLLLFFLFL